MFFFLPSFVITYPCELSASMAQTTTFLYTLCVQWCKRCTRRSGHGRYTFCLLLSSPNGRQVVHVYCIILLASIPWKCFLHFWHMTFMCTRGGLQCFMKGIYHVVKFSSLASSPDSSIYLNARIGETVDEAISSRHDMYSCMHLIVSLVPSLS